MAETFRETAGEADCFPLKNGNPGKKIDQMIGALAKNVLFANRLCSQKGCMIKVRGMNLFASFYV